MKTHQAMDFMVIDDRTVAAIDLETQLEDMGHRVVAVASHLDRAFERLEKSAGAIDGVFLNPSLAGCSARPVAEKLFRLGLPYVLLTEMGTGELRRLGMRGPTLPYPRAACSAGLCAPADHGESAAALCRRNGRKLSRLRLTPRLATPAHTGPALPPSASKSLTAGSSSPAA